MAQPIDAREPGRIRTMWRIFQMTRKQDRVALPLMIGAALLPIAAAIVLALVVAPGDVLFTVLWIVSGVLVGLMLLMLTLTWRAEKLAFSQIEGKPGAVGAVLSNGLRGSWQSSEMPVAVNTKTQDAVYRAVGRGGVVLIAEGPASRTKRMLEDERRKVSRILPNVPVTFVNVGPDEDSVPLHKVPRTLAKTKKVLTKAEVLAVKNRLASLNTSLPIPKGVDPFKVRPQRSR